MPTTQASPAVGATRPLRRRAATGGEDSLHQTQSQEGKGKGDALTLLSLAYFRSAVKVKPFGRASATLTEIEYPLLVKRVFKPSPSRHRGYAAKPPTATAAVRVGYADHASVAGRRGYAPLRRRAATGGGTSHQTQSQEVRAKAVPLPSYLSVFSVLSRSSPSGAQARP